MTAFYYFTNSTSNEYIGVKMRLSDKTDQVLTAARVKIRVGLLLYIKLFTLKI